MVRSAAAPFDLPTPTILPSLTATSAWNAGSPEPSTTRTFLMSRSNAIAFPPAGRCAVALVDTRGALPSLYSRRACYLDLGFMASVGVRQPVPARGGLYVSACPSGLSGDAGRAGADPGKGALHPVA